MNNQGLIDRKLTIPSISLKSFISHDRFSHRLLKKNNHAFKTENYMPHKEKSANPIIQLLEKIQKHG